VNKTAASAAQLAGGHFASRLFTYNCLFPAARKQTKAS